MSINLKTLISKLNDTSRTAATRAAGICVGLGQYEVDLEHLFLALLEQPASDFALIARHSGISVSMLEADLQAEVARLQTGNARTPVFSPRLPKLFENAWLIASLDVQAGRQASIRSAHLLQALLTDPELAQLAYRGSKLFNKFKLDDLKHNLDKITQGSQEAAGAPAADGEAGEGGDPVGELEGRAAASKTPALDQFTTNLTARARDGKVDPVIGRDAEIRQAIDILMRRRQNNPILTGEAGVGKTAVVEGLALRIAQDDVPDVLKGVEIHTLDMGLLQAGASVKGEFENRLKNVIDEVKKSPHAIILFIDEAHTMIGAGGTAGQNDAANLLKPALARGELRTIAATTWGEYKKYFEKDAALARRFQVVKIEEPSEELACAMLRGMAPLMEKHFNVRIYDEAITEAVRLSHRYIMGRQLPDKAISVLDTACAKVALGQNATPALLENLVKKLDRIDAEVATLEREEKSGGNHPVRLKDLRAQRSAAAGEHAALAARWENEKTLTGKVKGAREELESAGAKPDASQAGDLQALLKDLRALQGETPMVPVQVDGHVVAEIVAGWTGIPLGKMVKDEIRTVLKLKDMLEERVLGQSHAIEAVAQRVRTSRANLDDPNKPKGVFLFVGPSGVGKTETALALADVLYGGERKLITINMSEYQEAHSVSGLKGSPPGYVGYGEGGVLTEAVRRNPYSVVLLDEVEKAHPDVLELFFQVFDKGVMEDAEGREIDFKNTIIILTSNVGSGILMQACLNVAAADLPTPEQLEEKIRPQLVKTFKPAFLGRLKVIPFYPISDDVLVNIIGLKLGKIAQRIAANHKAEFSHDEALVEAVLARCTEVDSGARNVDNILNGTVLPEIAESVLAKMAEGAVITKIKVSASKQGQFKYTIK
ncbi:type VI secretion system ATPase TssH [Janthinobacterium lividum]|uniref:Type VI secretion system ATPase TssH n=1 Tax=Janthinobacterium lividum TaxID=29581 RepID=A0ABU0Y3Y4_9BURK|nr:type VI secretion system ATPase TssH [Janthinobacterium lividum]MDQ4629875.1 type VI secretion system ATPase TssH [Janthinobacterium lividum]MDQ4678008.1 type VI secretion system ATPase TssH [Janthinobacterium lividum]MDQ4688128.1 type VI secretion system ATPase TssH [Janthinobacterium lividum]